MAGRPSTYDPSYCDMVVAWGREGKSVAWIASELDVAKQTLFNWAEAHPDFLDALTRAKTHAQRWWEDAGQNGMFNPGFNASVYGKSMAARFPEDWRDNSKVEHVGANGGAIKQAMTIEFVDAGSVPKQA